MRDWYVRSDSHQRQAALGRRQRQIAIDRFDDPKIEGVACHISRPQRGGVSGALGTAEDRSEVAVACRQIGPIVFKKPIEDGETIFDERRSLLFKSLQVVRFFDTKRNVLLYVAYSDKVIAAELDLDRPADAPGGRLRPRRCEPGVVPA